MNRTIAWTRASIVERLTPNRLTTSYGEAPEVRPHVIVEIGTAEGLVGLGEASPLPEFTGETAHSTLGVLRETYLDALAGRDATQMASVMADLEHLRPGNPSARAAIDLALHDLAGKILGVPTVTLLGGARRGRPPAVTRAWPRRREHRGNGAGRAVSAGIAGLGSAAP